MDSDDEARWGIVESSRVIPFSKVACCMDYSNLGNIRALLSRLGYVLFFVKDDGGISQDEALIQKPLINLFACPAHVFPDLRSF